MKAKSSRAAKAHEFSKKARDEIFMRDLGQCIFCRQNYHMEESTWYGRQMLSIMHYIPRSKGGLGIVENGALGCAFHHEMLDNGIDLARLNYEEMRQLRSEMQLIFQDPYSSLNPRMSVGQIVGEGMFAHGFFKKNSPRSQDEILRVMEECGLAPYFVHRYPYQFSGGQRQRIGIARSLATRPKFVVCDEAVSALDVSIQSQIINLLSDLKDKQNLTYLFITHDLSVVKYISDRIGVMYLGNIVELSESQELFDHPLHPYTEALLSAIPTTNVDDNRELVILEGDIPSPVNPPKGCKFHTRCKYCTDECTKITPEMKEVRPNHFVACHHTLETFEDKTIQK